MAVASTAAGERIRGPRANVKREIVHQGSLKHPFIVGLKEVGPARVHRAGWVWASMPHCCCSLFGPVA